MTGQQLREALHSGKRVYGSCLVSPSVWAVVPYTQLDFAFIDNEHCPLDRQATMVLCQTYKARGVVPLVRVPAADPALATMALDAGAEGIICPYVEHPGQVRAMVGAVKLRPLKGDRLAAFLRTGEGLDPQTRRYLDRLNHNNVLIINVESTPAVDRLDDLLAVDGLDAVLVGPHDLSVSLDMPEQYEAPEFIAAVESIITKARRAGLGAGVHCWENLDRELHYIRKGANLIVHSTDVREAARAINSALSDLRAAVGDRAAGTSAEGTVI
jgi:2-keto-3-deoxy-L-rhamnonate aldolase RhmA